MDQSYFDADGFNHFLADFRVSIVNFLVLLCDYGRKEGSRGEVHGRSAGMVGGRWWSVESCPWVECCVYLKRSTSSASDEEESNNQNTTTSWPRNNNAILKRR